MRPSDSRTAQRVPVIGIAALAATAIILSSLGFPAEARANSTPVANADPGPMSISRRVLDGGSLYFPGAAVSVSTSTALVGATGDDSPVGFVTGTAHVLTRQTTGWVEQGRLYAADGVAGDWFGCSVAVSGDTAVIGACLDDGSAGRWAGSAYVFARSGTTWTQQAKLTAPDGAPGDWFGCSVAVSTDTIVVGSEHDTTTAQAAGSAYVFVRSGDSWTQQAKLTPSGASRYQGFGRSVGIAGDYIVVGSNAYNTAYVFKRSGTTWSQQVGLTVPGPDMRDYFGYSVAISGDTVAIGAPGYDAPAKSDAGATYVYTRSGVTWTQQAKLTAASGAAGDRLGDSVAIDADTLLAGSPQAATGAGPAAGSTALFLRSGGIWTQQPCAADSNSTSGGQYGYSVALAGDTAVVGTGNGDAHILGSWQYTTRTGTPLGITSIWGVLANDSDADSDTLGAQVYAEPSHGTLSLDPEGSFIYTPQAGWSGIDTFAYRAFDGTTFSVPATVTVTVKPAGTVTRIPGSDRYAVTANMARKGWRNTDGSWDCTHVIVACGEDRAMADPLAAAGLAGVYHAPILLTKSATVPYATKKVLGEIAARNPRLRVHLVGGTLSVPDARWTDIRRIAGVSGIKDRITGSDRYAVTVNIAKRMVSVVGTTADFAGVLIMCSENPAAFYDALAASPASFKAKMPMLGVRKAFVPIAVQVVLMDYLAGKKRYAVSSSTYINSTAYALAGCTQRLTNTTNRYVAATQIADQCVTRNWLARSDTAITARLSDALGGGAFMGNSGGVMLYTTVTNGIQTNARSWIDLHSDDIYRGWIFGGTSSVPSGQETAFRNLLQ